MARRRSRSSSEEPPSPTPLNGSPVVPAPSVPSSSASVASIPSLPSPPLGPHGAAHHHAHATTHAGKPKGGGGGASGEVAQFDVKLQRSATHEVIGHTVSTVGSKLMSTMATMARPSGTSPAASPTTEQPPSLWKDRVLQIDPHTHSVYIFKRESHTHTLSLKGTLQLNTVKFLRVPGAPSVFTFEISGKSSLIAAQMRDMATLSSGGSSWTLCVKSEQDFVECTTAMLRVVMSSSGGVSNWLKTGGLFPPAHESNHNAHAHNASKAAAAIPSGPSVSTAHSSESGDALRVTASLLLTNIDEARAAQTKRFLHLVSNWTFVAETLTGLGILNVLLMILVAGKNGWLESMFIWLAVNLLVAFGVFVRFDQLVGIDAFRASLLQREESLGAGKRSPSGGSKREGSLARLIEAVSDEDEDALDPDHASPSPAAAGLALDLLGRSKSSRSSAALAAQKYAMDSDLPMAAATDAVPAPHSWMRMDATRMQVRSGPDYPRNKLKINSAPSLFNLLGCDLIHADSKVDRIGTRFVLPDPRAEILARGGPQHGYSETWLPCHLLIVNLQCQDANTSVFSATGSPGFSLVQYYEPSEDFFHQLRRAADSKATRSSPLESSDDSVGDEDFHDLDLSQLTPAARLALRYLTRGDHDNAMRDRTKFKAEINNPKDCGLPSWTMKFNGKPAMLTTACTISRYLGVSRSGREVQVIEIAYDLRLFGMMTRQGLNAALPGISRIDFNLALIVQGTTDDELPEQILCGARFVALDLSKARELPLA